MAELIPFPSRRRVDRVARVARRMAMLPRDEGEKLILREATVEYNRLLDLGIADDLIEADVISFAHAIRAQLWREVLQRPGGAA